MAGYGILISFQALPGKADDLYDALMVGSRMMTAAGCGIHLTSRDTEKPDLIWVVEFWDSKETHDAALAHPDAAALSERVWVMTADGGQRVYLEGVGGHGLGPAFEPARA